MLYPSDFDNIPQPFDDISITETKICTKCKKELPANDKYFRKVKPKYKLKSECRQCEREYNKKYEKTYYKSNKERILKRSSEYHKLNAEKRKEKMKEYYKNNRESRLEYQKEYHKNNRDIILAKGREFRANEENKELIKKRRKQFYQDNKDKLKEKFIQYRPRKLMLSKMWRERNKDKIKIYNQKNKEIFEVNRQKRIAKKKELPNTLTAEQWIFIKDVFDNKCAYCGRELPLAQDHFIPLSKGGEYTVNNIIPACKSCNSSKRSEDFFKWYPNYEYYSKERERFILKYLEYKKDVQQLKII